MKERPILFNGDMVRAILSGSKTQTRRIVKHKGELPPDWATFAQPMSHLLADGGCAQSNIFRWSEEQTPGTPLKSLRRWPGNGPDLVYDWYAIPCPYGQPGDQLWVRETWNAGPLYEVDNGAFEAGDPYEKIPKEKPDGAYIVWAADGEELPYRPSIHMPRWASRITLEITSVRVERLQDISEADAVAEGVQWSDNLDGYHIEDGAHFHCVDAAQSYQSLWESINVPGSWDVNPWVWVIEFKRVEK